MISTSIVREMSTTPGEMLPRYQAPRTPETPATKPPMANSTTRWSADTVAQGGHPARVVSDPLEGQPQLGSDDVAQPQVQEGGRDEAHVVEDGRVLARLARRPQDLGEPDVAAEDVVVLQDEVEEAHREGKREHQEVDPVGPRGDRPEERTGKRCQDDGNHRSEDRREREPDGRARRRRARLERRHGQHVGGEPRQGGLRSETIPP